MQQELHHLEEKKNVSGDVPHSLRAKSSWDEVGEAGMKRAGLGWGGESDYEY